MVSKCSALVHRPKNQQPRRPGLLQETKDHVRTVTDLVNALDNADRDFVYNLPDTATIADYREALQQDLNFMKDKDPAGLYTRTVAELETYYDSRQSARSQQVDTPRRNKSKRPAHVGREQVLRGESRFSFSSRFHITVNDGHLLA
jgi:hypothetical protein